MHEAVEALGNLSDENTNKLIEQYKNSNSEISEMVLETCELALDLIKWNTETNFGESEGLDLKKLKFKTNDPAPPYNIASDTEKYQSVAWLQEQLLDGTKKLFDRYRAMFTLRELCTKESCKAIC